jgi:hypothetical protein
MGIRISEMEEATTFGADDYVPIVTNGTNKKALGAKIKDFIAGFFATKNGDNITDDSAFRTAIGINAANTPFVNTGTGMTAEDVQAGIEELNTSKANIDGSNIEAASFRAALGLTGLKVESLVLNTMITTTTDSTVNTYNTRKISDYDILIFHQIYENGDIRNTATIPVSVWKSGYSINMMAIHGSTSANASDYRASGLVISFNSDTAFSARYYGSGGIRTIAIYGVKLA